MTRLFVGIDVGTFETKGVLVDESGVVQARARHRHGVSTPIPGHVEHDADAVWWSDVVAVSQQLMSSPAAAGAEIAAVACSAIGPCVLPVDEDLRPLRAGILYGVDTRASQEIDEITQRLGEAAIAQRSGNLLTSQSAGPKIAWIVRNEPDVAARTRWYMTSQSYIVAKLTGRVTMDHGTAGYFHPLYDLASQRWDNSGLEDIVRIDQLPELGWATEIAGTVTEAAAQATGLPVGVPVAFGTTDAPAEAVGASVVDAGDLMLMYGSSTYMIHVLDSPRNDRTLWTAPFVFPNSFVLAAGTSTAGTVTRWVSEILNIDSTRGDEALFTELVALAQQSSVGSDGLLMIPHLSGERTPVHNAFSRGIFFGLSLAHTRSHVARAALEGIGHSVAHALSAYTTSDAVPERIVAIGGGTKNPIIMQTVSDISGYSQTIADSDGACFGDAAIAAYAVGHLTSKAAVAKWATTGAAVHPAHANIARLRNDHRDYIELYTSTVELQHRRTKASNEY